MHYVHGEGPATTAHQSHGMGWSESVHEERWRTVDNYSVDEVPNERVNHEETRTHDHTGNRGHAHASFRTTRGSRSSTKGVVRGAIAAMTLVMFIFTIVGQIVPYCKRVEPKSLYQYSVWQAVRVRDGGEKIRLRPRTYQSGEQAMALFSTILSAAACALVIAFSISSTRNERLQSEQLAHEGFSEVKRHGARGSLSVAMAHKIREQQKQQRMSRILGIVALSLLIAAFFCAFMTVVLMAQFFNNEVANRVRPKRDESASYAAGFVLFLLALLLGVVSTFVIVVPSATGLYLCCAPASHSAGAYKTYSLDVAAEDTGRDAHYASGEARRTGHVEHGVHSHRDYYASGQGAGRGDGLAPTSIGAAGGARGNPGYVEMTYTSDGPTGFAQGRGRDSEGYMQTGDTTVRVSGAFVAGNTAGRSNGALSPRGNTHVGGRWTDVAAVTPVEASAAAHQWYPDALPNPAPDQPVNAYVISQVDVPAAGGASTTSYMKSGYNSNSSRYDMSKGEPSPIPEVTKGEPSRPPEARTAAPERSADSAAREGQYTTGTYYTAPPPLFAFPDKSGGGKSLE